MVGGHVRLDRGHDLLVAVPASHVPALALDELGHDHPASAGIHAYAPCLGETLGGSWTHPRCAAVGDTARTHGGGGAVRRVSTSSVIADHGHPPPVSPVSGTHHVRRNRSSSYWTLNPFTMPRAACGAPWASASGTKHTAM